MNILKENKLINKFMKGYDFEHLDGGLPLGDFHTSWDWLMPVVRQCLIGEAEQNQSISETYYSVIEFIKFYNQTKTK